MVNAEKVTRVLRGERVDGIQVTWSELVERWFIFRNDTTLAVYSDHSDLEWEVRDLFRINNPINSAQHREVAQRSPPAQHTLLSECRDRDHFLTIPDNLQDTRVLN